jgi:hypothetical protein
MAGKASIENGKKGGRPKGTKNPETLLRESVLKEFRNKVMESADVLFNSQLHLARGQTYLYKIEKELQIGPKGGKKYVSSKPKIVTSTAEIESYLRGLIRDGDMEDENDPNATYYFLTTKEPDNRAIDSMLDRAFGKSSQSIELGNKDDNPFMISFDESFKEDEN